MRPEPKPPTQMEQQVLDLLDKAYAKADAAARAAARFEAYIHEKIVEQRREEGLSIDEAGKIDRVFKASEFNDTFRKFLVIGIERKLIETLSLDEYEQEILTERIKDIFGPKPPPPKKDKPAQILVGSPEVHQLQELTSRRRRR